MVAINRSCLGIMKEMSGRQEASTHCVSVPGNFHDGPLISWELFAQIRELKISLCERLICPECIEIQILMYMNQKALWRECKSPPMLLNLHVLHLQVYCALVKNPTTKSWTRILIRITINILYEYVGPWSNSHDRNTSIESHNDKEYPLTN